MMLQVCQDIVGNTICADFLDYLYRDWYHLGKPLYKDERLYQYMEVSKPSAEKGTNFARFVINVGPSDKIRHDALTDILELLNARYKLAETVLFHRTKLALTGVLDRCLLEIAEIYRLAGFQKSDFNSAAEALLLQGSDDALSAILSRLAGGGTEEAEQHIKEHINLEREKVQAAVMGQFNSRDVEPLLAASQPEIDAGASGGELQKRMDLAKLLIERLRDREVYTLAYKLRMSDLPMAHTPDNPHVQKLLGLYRQPQKRLEFLEKVEVLCQLPAGHTRYVLPT